MKGPLPGVPKKLPGLSSEKGKKKLRTRKKVVGKKDPKSNSKKPQKRRVKNTGSSAGSGDKHKSESEHVRDRARGCVGDKFGKAK